VKASLVLAAFIGAFAAAALVFWLTHCPEEGLCLRLPGDDKGAETQSAATANPVLSGVLTRSNGTPASLRGAWPEFRGPNRNAISPESCGLLRTWRPSEPRELWAVDLGEGYAGAAVANGRVYIMDYDRDKKQDALRCLSLADGREIWRYAYPVSIKRNHGMTRTVPAIHEKFVVAMGPKCHVVCLEPKSGRFLWGLDLVRQFRASVPPWYAGQCPLVDGAAAILAPGGTNALMIAVDGETGKILWQTPNPHGWKMTHSSIMPMDYEGERMYIYCADKGVVGVSARDGSLLWETTDWKISIATVPSPLAMDGGKLLLTGGYNAGSLLLQLKRKGQKFHAEPLLRFSPAIFGATQHTPILYNNHLYGTRADGKFVCLTPDGKVVWSSPPGQNFGLGSFILANGVFLAMDDAGMLRLIEATPEKYHLLAQASVLHGRESWAPLAIAGGRLLARDFTRMVCLQVGDSSLETAGVR